MNALVLAALRAAHRALSSPMRPPKNWRLVGPLELAPIGKKRWKATIYPWDPLRLHHVPTGRCLCPAFVEMDTDLASVPEVLQAAFRSSKTVHIQADSFPKSAVFHDALYTAGFCWAVHGGRAFRAPVTRAQADAFLFLCLCCEGTTGYDAVAWYNGVRLGGASHWNAARRENAQWPPLFGESTAAGSEENHGGPAQQEAPCAAPCHEALHPATQPEREGREESNQRDCAQNGGERFH